MNKLNDMLEQHRMFHDDVQLHCFILGGRHPWGRYKQALRELYKRVRGVRMTTTERDNLLVDVDELKEKSVDNKFDERRRDINLREYSGCLEELERTLHNTEREARHFYAEASLLHDQFKDITDEERRCLDLEAWSYQWRAEAAASLIATSRVPLNTVNNVMKMPKEYRERTLAMIKDNAGLIAWYEQEFGENELNPLETDFNTNLIEGE